MNEPEPELGLYRVAFSERVRTALRALIDRAAVAGHGRAVLDALVELDACLRIYPQYGECRRDLSTPGQSQWQAAFPPLVVDYVIDEPNRAVYVVIPIRILPFAGFQ